MFSHCYKLESWVIWKWVPLKAWLCTYLIILYRPVQQLRTRYLWPMGSCGVWTRENVPESNRRRTNSSISACQEANIELPHEYNMWTKLELSLSNDNLWFYTPGEKWMTFVQLNSYFYTGLVNMGGLKVRLNSNRNQFSMTHIYFFSKREPKWEPIRYTQINLLKIRNNPTDDNLRVN